MRRPRKKNRRTCFCTVFRMSKKKRSSMAQTNSEGLRKGDAHPSIDGLFFHRYNRNRTESWVTLDELNQHNDRAAAAAKRHIEKNPEKADKAYGYIFQRAYREYKEGAITKEEYEKVCALGKLQAVLNTGLARKDKWNLDHIIPSTHGGLTTVQNLQMVPNAWNLAKNNRNRNVKALQGSDYDVWYHTPYVFPKRREWTQSLADKEITTLVFVPNLRGT